MVHSTSATIDKGFHNNFNVLIVLLTDGDMALWEGQAQEHSYIVRSHITKFYVSCQQLHCACYTSGYQPIFTSCGSPFPHNISLTQTLGQDTE
jgi:hypothetical protein